MTDEAILARLAALEARVACLPDPLERRHYAGEQPAWLKAMAEEAVQRRRDVIDLTSVPDVATIRIVGEIDEAMARDVHDQLDAAHLARTLHVHIDSHGGDYTHALSTYRALRWHTAGVKIAFLGKKVMSAGLLVMLGCDRRIARQDTELLLHLVGDVPAADERWTVDRHIEAARRLRSFDSEMLNITADRSGADLHELAREAATEEPSTLEWAMRHGLIHEVAA